MNKARWIAVAIVSVLAVVLIASRQARSQGADATDTVALARVQLGTIGNTVSGTGALAPADTAALGWRSAGKVAEVLVQPGQQVKAGRG